MFPSFRLASNSVTDSLIVYGMPQCMSHCMHTFSNICMHAVQTREWLLKWSMAWFYSNSAKKMYEHMCANKHAVGTCAVLGEAV